MTKTVKQIAADCGVSEQAIRAWCRRNHIAKDAKHGFVIDETTLSAIYQHYRVDKRKQVSQRAKASFATRETSCETDFGRSSHPSVPWEVYEDMRSQLEAKDRQIADLSKALVSSQESLRAAQILHGVDKKEVLLEAAAEGAASDGPDGDSPKGDSRKDGNLNLFDRIFGRKER